MMSNLQKMKQILISSAFITMETKHIRNIRRGFGSNSNEIDPDVIDTFIGYDAPYSTRSILSSTDFRALYNKKR